MAVVSSSIITINFLMPALPFGAMTPCSDRCDRKALIVWVRWPINI
jgi:hypothetical protein